MNYTPDEYDAMFNEAARTVERIYITDIDTRFYTRRKRRDDPIEMISKLPIAPEIKKEAEKYFRKYMMELDLIEKDAPACVFWATYAASRKMKIAVALETIARLSGLGMEKYEGEVKVKPLEFGVKPNHKKITNTLTYFKTLFDKTEAEVNMTPNSVQDFVSTICVEQGLSEHEDFVFEFLETLLEDELWQDQNPNILAYATLIYLSNQKICPFYKTVIQIPIYLSKNIITAMYNNLKMEMVEIDDLENDADIVDEDEDF